MALSRADQDRLRDDFEGMPGRVTLLFFTQTLECEACPQVRQILAEITDGTSNTLLLGEVDYGHAEYLWEGCGDADGSTRWGDPTWAHGYWFHAWGHMTARYPALYNSTTGYVHPDGYRAFRSDHPGGVQFVLCDGSVRFLDDSSDPAVREALVTRAGEELQAFLLVPSTLAPGRAYPLVIVLHGAGRQDERVAAPRRFTEAFLSLIAAGISRNSQLLKRKL